MKPLRWFVVLMGVMLVLLQGGDLADGTRPGTYDDQAQSASPPETGPAQPTAAGPTTTAPTTTTTTKVPCRVIDPGPVDDELTPAQAALTFSRRGHTCSDHVTVVADDPRAITIGARAAVDRGGPLLIAADALPEEAIADELRRLVPSTVTVVGPVEVSADVLPPTVLRPGLDTDVEPVGSADRNSPLVWVIGGSDPAATLPAAVMGLALDATVRLVGDDDIRRVGPGTAEDIRQASELRMVGLSDERRMWELAVVRRGLTLPGGDQMLFRGTRMVAAYGTPGSGALGVLGETGPAEALTNIQSFSVGYDRDGRRTIPTFEIIATIASAGAGEDDDYSDEVSLDAIRPWIAFAADHGVYVVLDLQPGRSDFLTQAKRFEEFLRLPHVGLALDPEWRLEPDQMHLRQIGSVDAAEVNQVGDWLATITRQGLLPQKLLLVHQFKLSMIENRESIGQWPELATVIQMDGQGPLGTKYDTYDALVSTAVDRPPWRWGWKNFFDEDDPMGTADQVLSVDPAPVFVSFQ